MGVVCIKREGEKRREKHLTCSLSIFPFRIFSSDLLSVGLNCCNDCIVNFVYTYPGTSESSLMMKAKLKVTLTCPGFGSEINQNIKSR